METVLIVLKVLLVLSALLMTFFILLQEGKGGGLAGLGGTSAAGVEGVTNPIRKATAYLAGVFFLMAVLIGFLGRSEESVLGKEQAVEKSKNAPKIENAGKSAGPAAQTVPLKIDIPEAPKKNGETLRDDDNAAQAADAAEPAAVNANETKTKAAEGNPKAENN
jgi:preprotein translocase subunit SecG